MNDDGPGFEMFNVSSAADIGSTSPIAFSRPAARSPDLHPLQVEGKAASWRHSRPGIDQFPDGTSRSRSIIGLILAVLPMLQIVEAWRPLPQRVFDVRRV